MTRAASETSDELENGLLEMVGGRVVPIGKNVAEARDAEELLVRNSGVFRPAVWPL